MVDSVGRFGFVSDWLSEYSQIPNITALFHFPTKSCRDDHFTLSTYAKTQLTISKSLSFISIVRDFCAKSQMRLNANTYVHVALGCFGLFRIHKMTESIWTIPEIQKSHLKVSFLINSTEDSNGKAFHRYR